MSRVISVRWPTLCGFCVLALAVVALFAVRPQIASASGGTFLCGPSYDYACAGGGYNGTSARTPADAWSWQKYGGRWADYRGNDPHNCTLYVAFRLRQNGVTDPGWSAQASDWARMSKSPPPGGKSFATNKLAAVGSVAVWVGGNHVAYVESVSYAGQLSIVVSEDTAGYMYTAQRRLTLGQPGWPDWFIHFKDQGHIPGDINSDGKVGPFDLEILLSEYGGRVVPPRLNADLDDDGIVTPHDMSILLAHYGASVSKQRQRAFAAAPSLPAPRSTRGAGAPQQAPSKPARLALQAYASPISQGDGGILAVDARGMKRCVLTLRGPHHARAGPFAGALSGKRFLTYRWRAAKTAQRGWWRITITCSPRHGPKRRIHQRVVVRGKVAGHAKMARAMTSVHASTHAPARHPGGLGATSCAHRGLDLRSGYCSASAAEYVWSQRPDASHLGDVSGWWHATNRMKGDLPKRGAIAWWAPRSGFPQGHVAFVEKVSSSTVWVGEEDAYGARVIDHARVLRSGADAPTGYIYADPRPGTAMMYFWPTQTGTRVGDTFTVAVRLDVSGDSATAGYAEFRYSAALLSYVSGSGAAPGGEGDRTWGAPRIRAAPGVVRIDATSTRPVTGDHPLALVTLRAVAPGRAALSLSSESNLRSVLAGDDIPVQVASGNATLLRALPPVAISSLSLGGPTTPVPQGTQFAVPVYMDVTRGTVDALSVDLHYPTTILSYVGTAVNSGTWGRTGLQSAGGGDVQLVVGATGGQAGTILVATVMLQAIAPGAADVTFSQNSSAHDATQDVEALAGHAGRTFVVP